MALRKTRMRRSLCAEEVSLAFISSNYTRLSIVPCDRNQHIIRSSIPTSHEYPDFEYFQETKDTKFVLQHECTYTCTVWMQVYTYLIFFSLRDRNDGLHSISKRNVRFVAITLTILQTMAKTYFI